MELEDVLKNAVERQVSDIFVIVGMPIVFKFKGQLENLDDERLDVNTSQKFIDDIYALAGRDIQRRHEGDDDFSLSLKGIGRFRVNTFIQRGAWSAVLRVVAFDLPPIEEMGIPQKVIDVAKMQKGLVLVTGTAGSGKSTTLAYIIDEINKNRSCHILTLEDPIEYLHKHKKSIVSQREVGVDSANYQKALRAAMREAPDVILIGEMRDHETIEIAMTAAETGHLVLSTLHTVGAANTIDRVIDVFPANQQQQIRVQLSMTLKSVISQQLIPTVDGVTPAFEIMETNSAIKTMIREGKIHQIDSVIYSSSRDGMKSMDTSILELYQKGVIQKEEVLSYCMNPDSIKRNLL